jgi:hypothetical protein
MFVGKRRAARMPLDGVLIHLEAVHGVATITKCAKNEILHGVLRTACGWKADEILREGDLLVESLVDGRDDAVANARVERHEEMSFDLAIIDLNERMIDGKGACSSVVIF